MVKKKIVKKKKQKVENKVKVVTGWGRFSYPFLAEPDTGRQYSDDKYKTDFLMPKATFKAENKELIAAVLKVGRTHFGDDSLSINDFENPFKDTDKLDNYSSSEKTKGHIKICAKSDFAPTVVGPDKKELKQEQIEKIKGGDHGRLVVVVYPYDTDQGGVTVGLNLVQFKQEGEAFGQGNAENLALIDEVEIDSDDLDIDDEDEDEAPKKKKSAPAKKASKKKVVEEEEEEEEDDFDMDDSDEEEEEEAPPAKKKSKAAPAKKASKKKVVEEEDEEEEESEESDDDDSDDFDFDD